MKLRMSFINSLPALPFGAFKLGAEMEMDTTVQCNQQELEVMAQAMGIPPQNLYVDLQARLMNPIMAAHVMQSMLNYVHTYQYNQAANLPVGMFSLPQLPPPGTR